jgi:hypothetical protein
LLAPVLGEAPWVSFGAWLLLMVAVVIAFWWLRRRFKLTLHPASFFFGLLYTQILAVFILTLSFSTPLALGMAILAARDIWPGGERPAPPIHRAQLAAVGFALAAQVVHYAGSHFSPGQGLHWTPSEGEPWTRFEVGAMWTSFGLALIGGALMAWGQWRTGKGHARGLCRETGYLFWFLFIGHTTLPFLILLGVLAASSGR